MAEPRDPNTPGAPGAPGGGNGGNNNIDREMTPLASKQNLNRNAVFAVGALAFLSFMWWVGAFSQKQPEPEPAPEPVQTQQAPPLVRPTVRVVPPPPVYTPPADPLPDLDAERERLLLLKVRGLQKQMFERRRSPMLVVSDPVATPGRPRPVR